MVKKSSEPLLHWSCSHGGICRYVYVYVYIIYIYIYITEEEVSERMNVCVYIYTHRSLVDFKLQLRSHYSSFATISWTSVTGSNACVRRCA